MDKTTNDAIYALTVIRDMLRGHGLQNEALKVAENFLEKLDPSLPRAVPSATHIPKRPMGFRWPQA